LIIITITIEKFDEKSYDIIPEKSNYINITILSFLYSNFCSIPETTE
jgi:hypothetical protein